MGRAVHTRQGAGWGVGVAATPGYIPSLSLHAASEPQPPVPLEIPLEIPLPPRARACAARFLPGSSSASWYLRVARSFQAEARRNQIPLGEIKINFEWTQLFLGKEGRRHGEGEKIFQEIFREISKGLQVIRKIFLKRGY